MPKWKRVVLRLGVAVIVLGAYGWLFGSQTMTALLARYEYRKLPDVGKTPVVLTDLSISSTAHRTVSYFGYEFELPWDDVDEQKDETGGQIHLTFFRSGNTFWFSTFPAKDFVNGIVKMGKLDPKSLRQLYGDEAVESDYGFHRIMLLTTPYEITPFISRRQAAARALLLTIKGIAMPKARSGIFSIQAADFRGFQFENPQSRPQRITVELYSDDGGIDLIFAQTIDGSAPMISQPEINRVIQSIHKIPVRAASFGPNEPK